MFKKESEYIGISLVDNSLKIAHLKLLPQGNKVINVAKRDLQGVAPEEHGKLIRGLLDEMGLKKPEAIYSVSSNMVTTKNIEIPSVDPAEIKSIIDLQAGRHTPYAREEIIVGYINIGVFQRNYTKVLLVIVHRDQVLKQVRAMASAGIKVNKVIFGPEAQAAFYAKSLAVNAESRPIAILDMCQDKTDFLVEWNNTVVTARSIPVGVSQVIKEGKSATDKLLTEIAQSLEVYQSEDIGQPPEQFVLTGDDAKIQELVPIIQDRIKYPTKNIPYQNYLQLTEVAAKKVTTEFKDDSFLNVISSVVMRNQVTVDLTPDEVRSQRAIEEQGKHLVYAGILGMAIFLMIFGVCFNKIYFRTVTLEKLKSDLEKKQLVTSALNRIAAKTQIIKDFAFDRMTTLDIVETLYKFVPEPMYLQNIDVDEIGVVNVLGTTEAMSQVFDLQTALEKTDLFKQVKVKSTTTKQERGKEVVVFDLNFRLESAPDAEEENKETEAAKAEAAGTDKKAKAEEAKEGKKEEKTK